MQINAKNDKISTLGATDYQRANFNQIWHGPTDQAKF